MAAGVGSETGVAVATGATGAGAGGAGAGLAAGAAGFFSSHVKMLIEEDPPGAWWTAREERTGSGGVRCRAGD